MTDKEIYGGISGIDEKYLEISEKNLLKKRKALKITIALAACFIAVLAGVIILPGLYYSPEIIDGNATETVTDAISQPTKTDKTELSDFSVASPLIPVQTKLNYTGNTDSVNTYYEERNNRINSYSTDRRDFEDFFNAIKKAILTENDGKNKVIAPSNLYIALSMLMSSTDGDTAEQILDVLGAENIENAERIAECLLKANYIDDGQVKSIISNSLWTGEKYTLYEDTLKELSQKYYADIFKGDASDSAYTDALQKWLSSSTDNLLNSSAGSVKFDPEMALTLVSTEYFAGRWTDEFDPENNTEGIFRSSQGEESATFMNSLTYGNCYYGKHYSAVLKYLYNGSAMYFILPTEGTSPEELLKTEELNSFIFNSPNEADSKFAEISLSIPKFDVSCDYELSGQLKSLGITDIFDSQKADFSVISSDKLYLSTVNHSARVKIDEEGVEAAAFTVAQLCGSTAQPTEKIQLTFDRPFIFVITGDTGNILFMGIVNTVS